MSPDGTHDNDDTAGPVPDLADDLAVFLFDHLHARELHPVMSRRGRADARLGVEVVLEAYGIGPWTAKSEFVRATIAALRLIDAHHGAEALTALAHAARAHGIPVDDLTETARERAKDRSAARTSPR